jgi:DNA-binding NarL/FixJ family response regulator
VAEQLLDAPLGLITLVGTEPLDEVCQLLRAAGASVTIHRAGEELTAVPCQEPRALVVLTSAASGRRLHDAVAALAGRPDRRVVVICARPRLGDVRSVLLAGASGVVLREQMHGTLAATLQAVASGQVCVPHRHARDLERPVLSIREKQVVGMVAGGLMNSEIAERLFLAESTVKSHLSSAFGKLGVRSRHEAVELLVDPASAIIPRSLSLDPTPPQSPPAAGPL